LFDDAGGQTYNQEIVPSADFKHFHASPGLKIRCDEITSTKEFKELTISC